MQSGMPTQELVIAAKKGDRKAFEQLVQRFEDRLRRLVESRIGIHLRQRIEANDVIQETFAKAYQSLDRFEWRGEDSFASWLRRISENVVLRVADRQKSERLFELQRCLDQPDSEVTASRVVRRGERFERLERALACVSPDHREVMILARIEGLQMKEIAHRTDRSISAVQNLLFRALKELKKAFGDTESFHLPNRRLDLGGDEDAD